MNELKKIILIMTKGIFLGLSIIIPGLCSASLAIILGIYEDMLELLGNFYKLSVIKKKLYLIIGIISGLIIGLIVVKTLSETYPILITSFFFIIIIKGIKKEIVKESYRKIKSLKKIIGLIIGLSLVLGVNLLKVNNQGTNLSFFKVYLIGLILSLAFILPGISGALLLLTMGVYYITLKEVELIINNIKDFRLFVGGQNWFLLALLLGLITGLISFARFIKYVLKTKPEISWSIIVGFMVGSLLLLIKDLGVMLINNQITMGEKILTILSWYFGIIYIAYQKKQTKNIKDKFLFIS